MAKLNKQGEKNLKILFSIVVTILIAATLAILFITFPVIGIVFSAIYVVFLFVIKILAERSKATFLDTYNQAVGGVLGELISF